MSCPHGNPIGGCDTCDEVDAAFEAGKRSALAEQPAHVQQGWKLVPIEPTEDMWKAVNKLDDEMAAGSYDGKGCSIEQAWNCLLAAAPQPAQQEPVDFASLLREADEIVREKPTWRRFIDDTPLSNDIAVWMTVFAQDVARRTSLAAQPQQEPVAFLANGTRFKISYDSRQSGGQIHGIPPELVGRWVAFVAADDDCHLKLTSPPEQRKPLTLREIGAVCGNFSDETIKVVRQTEAAHGITSASTSPHTPASSPPAQA